MTDPAKLSKQQLVDLVCQQLKEAEKKEQEVVELQKEVAQDKDIIRQLEAKNRQLEKDYGLKRQTHSIWDYAGLAAAVGLILLAIAFAFRASSLRHQAATLNAKTRAEFRRLFPEERLNAPVERLLAAKLELAERIGELSEFGQTNRNQVALLARVLRGLKGVPDLKVSKMVLQGNTVELTGSVSNLEQFEQLKTSLKDSGLESGIDSDYSADFTLRLTVADVDSLP